MAPGDGGTLEVRARKSYELGRALWALRHTSPLLVFLAAALALGHERVFTLGDGILLLAASAGLLWRGQVYGRAVLPGVVAGAVPFALSVLAANTARVCTPRTCFEICLGCCVGGGLLAGFVLGRSAARLRDHRAAFLVSAGVVAVLVASPGCIIAGVAGLVGMLAGVALGTAPAVFAATTPA